MVGRRARGATARKSIASRKACVAPSLPARSFDDVAAWAPPPLGYDEHVGAPCIEGGAFLGRPVMANRPHDAAAAAAVWFSSARVTSGRTPRRCKSVATVAVPGVPWIREVAIFTKRRRVRHDVQPPGDLFVWGELLSQPPDATRERPATGGIVGTVSRVPRIFRAHVSAADGRPALFQGREVAVRGTVPAYRAPGIEPIAVLRVRGAAFSAEVKAATTNL